MTRSRSAVSLGVGFFGYGYLIVIIVGRYCYAVTANNIDVFTAKPVDCTDNLFARGAVAV